jgi:Flp pilus assembly protein TadG
MNVRGARHSFRHGQRGQALVELALVVPVLLLLFMGIFDFGRAIYAYNAISNAAREGGRTAIVNQYAADIYSRASAQATALGIPASCPGAGQSGVCVSSTPPDATVTCPAVACIATVTVTYKFAPITPFISVILPSITLVSTTKVPVENVCSTGPNICPIP